MFGTGCVHDSRWLSFLFIIAILVLLPHTDAAITPHANLTGFLTCSDNITTKVLLHTPNVKGGQAIIYIVSTIDDQHHIHPTHAVLKVTRFRLSQQRWINNKEHVHPTRAVLNVPLSHLSLQRWITDDVVFAPPHNTNTFLTKYVPSTFLCQLNEDNEIDKSIPVLLKERVFGFDMASIPSSIVSPKHIDEAKRGVQLHKTLRRFLQHLASYECDHAHWSLFDVKPSNIMFGYRGSIIRSTPSQLLKYMYFKEMNKEEKIFLVDFTVHDDPTFYRPDYIWNDRQNEIWWEQVEWPKSGGGGVSFHKWFEHARVDASEGRRTTEDLKPTMEPAGFEVHVSLNNKPSAEHLTTWLELDRRRRALED